MTNLIAACMNATSRNADATLLLYSIIERIEAGNVVQRDGHDWIAKSAADWCEAIGFSVRRYQRAIARLRQLGLAVTEQHLHANRAITFVRLTEAGEKLVWWQGEA